MVSRAAYSPTLAIDLMHMMAQKRNCNLGWGKRIALQFTPTQIQTANWCISRIGTEVYYVRMWRLCPAYYLFHCLSSTVRLCHVNAQKSIAYPRMHTHIFGRITLQWILVLTQCVYWQHWAWRLDYAILKSHLLLSSIVCKVSETGKDISYKISGLDNLTMLHWLWT